MAQTVLIIGAGPVGLYRLLADPPPSGGAQPATPDLEEVRRVVARRGPPGMEAFDPIWLSGFRINGRKVASYRWDRAFLCGDAAHVHQPPDENGVWLVRPDGYVAAVAHAGDWSPIEQVLARAAA